MEGYWLRELSNRRARRALVKLPRTHEYGSRVFERGEAWAEFIASRLGRYLELPVPDVELVTFRGRVCPLIYDFRPAGFELREGVDILGISQKSGKATLKEAYNALAVYIEGELVKNHLAKMVCFDILIGNPDRHQGNWGVLIPSKSCKKPILAPLYDHGGAFGSEMHPKRLQRHLEDGMKSFNRGFRYQFAVNNTRKRPRIPELLSFLEGWGGLHFIRHWTERITSEYLHVLLETVDADVLGAEYREFVRRLVIRRLARLRKVEISG